MPRPLGKKEAVRAAWILALRQNNHRQIRGVLGDGEGNVCAMGMLYEVLGSEFRAYENAPRRSVSYSDCMKLKDASGLSGAHLVYITRLNDVSHYSFSQIADAIEKLKFEKD